MVRAVEHVDDPAMSTGIGSLPVERVLPDGARVRWWTDPGRPRRSKSHLAWIVATLVALAAIALADADNGRDTTHFDARQVERPGLPEGIR